MITITPEIFEHACRGLQTQTRRWTACKAVRDFGPLSRWWLRSWVLDAAASLLPAHAHFLRSPFRLDQKPGACAIVFARNCIEQEDAEKVPSQSLLAQAFILPLQWRKDQAGSDGVTLPTGVRELADTVRASLFAEDSIKGHSWTLHLGDVDGIGAAVDLRHLDAAILKAESGWASLAAGLLLYANGGTPDPSILATGCWDVHDGLSKVGGLSQKLNGLEKYHIRRVFIPLQQRHDASIVNLTDINVDYLPTGIVGNQLPQAREALKPLLAALDVPPVDGTFMARCDYYLRLWDLDRDRAVRFYQNYLLRDVAERCRERTHRTYAQKLTVQTLVTSCSFSPELIPLAISTFSPRRCLILRGVENKKMDESLDRALHLLSNISPHCDCQINYVDLPDDQHVLQNGLSDLLTPLLDKNSSGSVAWDTTPGPKYLTIEMFRQARPQDALCYLVHQHVRRDLRMPGAEYYHIWQQSKEHPHG